MSDAAPLALVTGASTGIGAACVERLHAGGWRVLAGVRRDEDAVRVAAGREGIDTLQLDVTDDVQVQAAGERLNRVSEQGLQALVHCAGTAAFGPLEYLPVSMLRDVLEVNVVGTLAVTQVALPHLRSARGRVVFLGSVSGRVAPPFLGPYSSSKFALEGLVDCLRREVHADGIEVSLIEAGRTDTAIWGTALRAFEACWAAMPLAGRERYGDSVERLRAGAGAGGGMPASEVAGVVIEALTHPRPRTRYVVGLDAHKRMRMRWLPDRWLDRRLVDRARESRRS